MKVFCDGEFLHTIQEKQFLDSPEWDSFVNGQQSDNFQVRIWISSGFTVIYSPKKTIEKSI